MTNFVLLSHPRSGTNNLIGILNAHPDVYCAGEIFNPADNGHAYLRDSLGLEPFTERTPYYHVGEFFAAARAREGRKVIGFKLFAYQTALAFQTTLLLDKGVVKLLLRRRNLLAAYLSYALARQTGQWRLASGERRLPEPFDVDLDDAAHWLGWNRERLDAWQALLDQTGLPYFPCWYEELYTLATVNAIEHRLGVAPRSRVEHALKVQRSAEAYARIRNLDDLVGRLGADFGWVAPATEPEPALAGA